MTFKTKIEAHSQNWKLDKWKRSNCSMVSN
jgi:hypothetical protein